MVISDGSTKKPHCAGDLAQDGVTWDFRRCAIMLCLAAGCGGGSLVDSEQHAPSTCMALAKEEGTAMLSFPTVSVSARCWALPPRQLFIGDFDLQNKAIEIGNGSGPPWCVLSGPNPFASETSLPQEAVQLALRDDDGELIPLDTFDFMIAGEAFSEVCLSSNGYLAFGATCPPDLFDPVASMAAIAIFAVDLDPGSGGSVAYWEVPGERLVVRFMEVPLFGALDQRVNFQVELLAGGGVRIAYGEMPVDAAALVGHGFTRGFVQEVDLSSGDMC